MLIFNCLYFVCNIVVVVVCRRRRITSTIKHLFLLNKEVYVTLTYACMGRSVGEEEELHPQ
jgi:hypothetical protein